MFLAPYVFLKVLLTDLRERTEQRLLRDETGSVTLEQAVIATALFLAALALLGVIGRAITSRADQIQ